MITQQEIVESEFVEDLMIERLKCIFEYNKNLYFNKYLFDGLVDNDLISAIQLSKSVLDVLDYVAYPHDPFLKENRIFLNNIEDSIKGELF
jgi:hypothetical protein